MRKQAFANVGARTAGLVAAGLLALLLLSGPGDGIYGGGAAEVLYVLPAGIAAIAYGLPAGLAFLIATALVAVRDAGGFDALADALPSIVLAAMFAALGVHVHHLERERRRMRTAVRRLRAAQIARDELVSDFERSRRTDEVTGLGNRLFLEMELPRLLAEAGSAMSALAVLVLGLDGLRAYRDRRGELAGDRQLKALAAEWRGHLRESDRLARLASGEFVVVLPSCSPANARRVAERLAAATPAALGCNVGVASWDGTEDAESILARAEHAMTAGDHPGAVVQVGTLTSARGSVASRRAGMSSGRR